MKYYKIIIFIIMALFLVSAACLYFSIEKVNDGNKISIEKLSGEGKYEPYNEITDKKDISTIRNILNTKWENRTASWSRSPDYKFMFVNYKDGNPFYFLWISPNKDKVELIVEGNSMYVQLNQKKSKQLFETLTGKKLNE